MALPLTPVAAVFVVGDGAPFAYLVVPLRVLLVILAWRNLASVSSDLTADEL